MSCDSILVNNNTSKNSAILQQVLKPQRIGASNIVVYVICVVVALVGVKLGSKIEFYTPHSFEVIGSVTSIDWLPDKPFAEEVMRSPVHF